MNVRDLYAIQASDICEIFPRFQVYFIRHRSHTCWFLYEVLLPTLQSADLPASGAGSTTPQRAGTCYAKCMFLALRTLLAELGVSKVARRRIMFNFRFFFLEKMVADLDRISTTSRCRCNGQVDHQRSDHVDGGTETGRTPLCQRH